MIYLIRHGRTALNAARRLQGRLDEPLSDVGREQALRASEWFRAHGVRFDRAFSSPLCRAYETARILCGEGTPILADERLMELDCGPWEGADLLAPAPELAVFLRNPALSPPPEGMEPLSRVIERTGAFLRDLKKELSAEESVLIATHAIALKGVIENLAPRPDGGWWNHSVPNCRGFVFALRGGEFTSPEEFDYTEEETT